MKKKARKFNRFIAVLLIFAMTVSFFSYQNENTVSAAEIVSPVQAVDESIPDQIQGGAILHAFCWSFDTIIENMADIAAAGYTSIQTSPIQECLSTYPEMTIGGNGHWYYHYQPTDFTIGNYQVGTEAEFKAMCEAADTYGIKIIVDVVPNHTTVDTTQVSENLLNAVGGMENLYHETGLTNSSNYSNRLETTTYAVGNLPDINTENADYQDYFIRFLNQCIADGADGFRYDSAKHIGLPDDPRPEGVVNNFWNRVTTEITNAESIFNYGEVLQGSNERLAAFEDAIGATTVSSYGANVRTALVSNSYLVSELSSYMVDDTVDPNNLVTWVESHDNYYNDGSYSQIDNTQVVLGWAIIAARAEGSPLFFSRPEGSSTTNQYGTNTIGIAGDDNYKDDEVVAVNKFRNAMVGESENLVNPDGNAKVLMIERGSKGAVIVNGSNNKYPIDTTTNLADGTYINRTDDNSVFTVTNGKMSGVLPARSVVVLYGAETTNSTTVHFYNGNGWSNVYSYVSGSEVLGTYPGTLMSNDGDGWWRVTVPADVANGFTISFNDGASNKTTDLTVNDPAKLYFTSKDNIAYESKAAAESAIGIVKTTVHFFNSGSWNDVTAYVYVSGATTQLLGTWPGAEARNDGDGWWTVDIPAAPSDNLHVIFNNNNQGSQSADFTINDSTNVYLTNENDKKYTSKSEAQYDVDIIPGAVSVYFYNSQGWDAVNAYVWGNAETLGGWPGAAATDVGDGWWKIVIPEDPSMNLHVIFNGNGKQTGNILISDITNRYSSAINTNTYASKEALFEAEGISNSETTVYFYNSSNWDEVYAYASNGTDLLGAYPGTIATKGQNNWWSVTLPAGVAETLNVTFNDGSEVNKSSTFIVNDRVNIYYTGVNDSKYPSKYAAETALGVDATKTTVYFYNSSGWANVNAYVYGPGELLGGWPGTAAVSQGDGWWKIDIPYAADPSLHLIFNSGSGNQSGDFVISDSTSTYVTNASGTKYTSIVDAEKALGISRSESTVYFYNSKNWSQVYAYASKDGELLGAYPGTLATLESDHWYKITIPAGASDTLTVKFSDGGEDQSETYTVNDTAHIYYTLVQSAGYVTKIEAEVALGAAPTSITVHMYNGSDWPLVSAYAYGPDALVGAWPGQAATDEGDGWWEITIPAPASPSLHVIFNNAGAGSQTADFILDDFTNVYVTNVNGEMYASKAAAQEALEPTVEETFISVVTPAAITGVANGTAKTVAALGLPSTVDINTNVRTVSGASVVWDLDQCSYQTTTTSAQNFTVTGTITLPEGVVNSNNLSLVTTIQVSVLGANTSGSGDSGSGSDTGTGSGTGTGTGAETGTQTGNNSDTTVTLNDNTKENGNYVLPKNDIMNQIATSTKDTVTMNVSGATSNSDPAMNSGIILKAEILKAAMNAEKTLSIAVNDQNHKELYAWTFDKEELAASNQELSDVDLSLQVISINEDEVLDHALAGYSGLGLVLSFNHEGTLPAQASVKVYVGNMANAKAGSRVYLYHYNQENGKLDALPYSSDYIVDQNGYITVEIVHCSDYVALSKNAPAKIFTSLKDQMKLSTVNQTLSTGDTVKASDYIEIELPATLELVDSKEDKTSQSAVGAVTATYASSNSKVVTVDKDGTILAVGKGKAVVTTKLTLYYGATKKINTVITVKDSDLSFGKSTSVMKLGSKFVFTLDADGVDVKDITWTTSKKSIVVINRKTGVAVAKTKGTDYVIATVDDTSIKIKVVVK